ncbi:hypothetical protein HDV05_002743 [Chytridiales sp. JEL 0842]|nr:hypothetical protein HDV05_002743 [Chytridiales sp. JEL 0842]
MTVDDLNTNATWRLPNIQFQLVYENTRGSPAGAAAAAVSVANKGVVGVIGESPSGRTMPLALALNPYNVFQCSASSTGVDFSDKSNYPNFFRTIASDKYQGYAIANLINSYGWKRAAVVSVNAAYGFGVSSHFLTKANELGISVLRNEAYNPDDQDYSGIFASLKAADARIIVIIMYEPDAILFFREAKKQGMLGSKYVYIGTDTLAYDFADEGEDTQNLEGLLAALQDETGGGEFNWIAQRYRSQFGATPEDYSWNARDCLLTMRNGIAYMLNKGFTPAQILARNTGTTLREFVGNGFEGASGFVQYDENGDRNSAFVFHNFQPGGRRVAIKIDTAGKLTELRPVIFANNTVVAPLDGPVLTREELLINSGLGAALVALYMIGAIIAFLCIPALFYFKDTAPLKMVELPSLLLNVCGIIVMFFSVFGWVGKLEVGSIGCGIQQWMGWIGFSVFIQGLVARLWKFFVIYDNSRINPFVLSPNVLYPLSTLLTLGNLIVLIVWARMDPLQPTAINQLDQGKFRYECKSLAIEGSENIFNGVLMAYNGLLLVIALLLANSTKSINTAFKVPQFNLYAIQNILICSTVIIAIVYSPGSTFMSTLILRLFLTLVATYLSLFFVVLRPIYGAYHSLKGNDVLSGLANTGMAQFTQSMAGPSSDISTRKQSVSVDSNNERRIQLVNGELVLYLAVKDLGKTFATWKLSKVVFSTKSKALLLTGINSTVGDCIIASDKTQVEESKSAPDCLEIQQSTFKRALQFPDSHVLKQFREYFAGQKE